MAVAMPSAPVPREISINAVEGNCALPSSSCNSWQRLGVSKTQRVCAGGGGFCLK